MYHGIFRVAEQHRVWVYTLAGLQIFLGLIALSYVGLASVASVLYLGGLFVVSGIADIWMGFKNRPHDDTRSYLFFGVLYIIAGAMIILNPIANAVFLTFLISLLLLVSGAVEIFSSMMERKTGWGWFFAMGVVSFVLGASMLRDPLVASLWFIGTIVGIDLIFKGLSLFGFVWSLGHGKNSKTNRPILQT
jgi:uncharacterized membrane protein HdeD (DUF308 family)